MGEMGDSGRGDRGRAMSFPSVGLYDPGSVDFGLGVGVFEWRPVNHDIDT